MKLDKRLMRKARKERATERLKATRESNCGEHNFLPCEKPNMVLVRVGYEQVENVQQGAIKYWKCSRCEKTVL